MLRKSIIIQLYFYDEDKRLPPYTSKGVNDLWSGYNVMTSVYTVFISLP